MSPAIEGVKPLDLENAVPAAAPDDAVMAQPAEIAGAQEWVAAAFGGAKRTADQPVVLDLLFAGTEPPFSFVYGGAQSAGLLKTWPREVEEKELADRVQHTVHWTDAATGLRVTAVVSTFKRYPAVDWVLYFENQGAKDTPILENIQALDVQLHTAPAVVLHQLSGDNCSAGSFRPIDTAIEPGKNIRFAPNGGRSSNGTFPFFNLECAPQGLIAAIGWTGQWAASVERAANGTTRLCAGLERTRLLLHPGERIRSPRILLLPWQGDLTAAHNRFRRLMLFHYVPRQNGKPVLLPAFWQGYDRYNGHATWPTEAGQINAAQAAKECGCEFLWLDAAWFPGGFPNGVGNWVASGKFPNGLKPVSDAAHALGLKFIVWFEPERVAAGSQIAKEHPEFVHGANGGLFKLDDPAARRWLTDLLLKRIEEYGIDWYRNDFNMDPLDSWRKNDAPDRQGMTEIRYIEGLYAMWDEFIARRPGLVVDNCASGGRRIDLEMCMRSVPLWQSDISCQKGAEDAHQAQSCALSLYVPFHTPCAWFPTEYELHSTATAGLVVQFPFLDAGFAAQKEKARELVAAAKEDRRFWYGDLYPLTPISAADDHFMAFELFRPDLGEGIVLAFRRAKCPSAELALSLKGLDPAKKYWVGSRDGGSVAFALRSGEEWMKNGFTARLAGPRTSTVIKISDSDNYGIPEGKKR
ncbi:MAG: alpha-galactosidase [Planctomycetota bacterium]